MAETLKSELLDIVSAEDCVIGSCSRGEIHQRGLMHRSVHVLVFNYDGSILLQKRSMLKDECAGMWDTSCAGHVESGHGYDDTAPRELEEELGLDASFLLAPLFKMRPSSDSGWEFAMVYRTETDGPFKVAADEIDEVRWFKPECVDDWVNGSRAGVEGGVLTHGFREIWRRYRAEPVCF